MGNSQSKVMGFMKQLSKEEAFAAQLRHAQRAAYKMKIARIREHEITEEYKQRHAYSNWWDATTGAAVIDWE